MYEISAAASTAYDDFFAALCSRSRADMWPHAISVLQRAPTPHPFKATCIMSDDLLDAARTVRARAHAPYSGFRVGAAIRSAAGIHAGCNVENASYPEGTCAEAGAISAMVAAGATKILEVLIYADAETPVAPCGGCRQRLAEFAGPDVVVKLAGPGGISTTLTIAELLPAAFGAAQFKQAP